jgi:hypothetical protein
MEEKLAKIKSRIEHLLGDCIMLAGSVVFLGVYSMRERTKLRQELSRFLLAQGIHASDCWKHQEYSEQTKLFKSILREYGLKTILKNHAFQNALSQDSFAEVLFSLVFAPSCPVIFDPSGHLQEFL